MKHFSGSSPEYKRPKENNSNDESNFANKMQNIIVNNAKVATVSL